MKKMVFFLLSMAAITVLSACGKKSDNDNAGCPAGYGYYNNQCVPLNGSMGQCQAGYVYSTQYGCLPQAGCPQGTGMYNNQCVVANGMYNNSYYNQYNNPYYNQYNNPYYNNPYYYNQNRNCYLYYGQMVCQ